MTDKKSQIEPILKSLYWQGRKNADVPITDISVYLEIELIDQIYNQPEPVTEPCPDGEEAKPYNCKDLCENYPKCYPFVSPVACTKFKLKDSCNGTGRSK